MLCAIAVLPDIRRSCVLLIKRWLSAVLLLMLISQLAVANTATDNSVAITDVIVNRINIFSPEQAAVNPVYRLANQLHRTTIEQTIVRELGIEPGDSLSSEEVSELERVLRRTGLFATVSVRIEEDKNTGDAQLLVNTRDQFSMVAGANGSFLGGVGEVGFTVGERNLLGLGDSVTLSVTGNTNDEIRGAVSYSDLHFINRYTRALYQAGRTEEGDYYVLRFSRPYKTVNDRQAWLIQAESRQQDIDYYDNGLSVVQVPELKRSVSAERSWRSQKTGFRFRRGLAMQYSELQYQAIRGSQADTIEQPTDYSQLSASLILGLDQNFTHRKFTGLDTLRFVQDVGFGLSSELRFGLRQRATVDQADVLSPTIAASVSKAIALSDNSIARVTVSGSAVVNDNSTNWTTGLSAKFYHSWSDKQQLATRLDYRHAESEGQLPVQYTLGEGNGLRGYDNRLLAGNERLLINLEHRMALDRRLGILDAGLLGFADIGWISQPNGEEQFKRAAGVGLRLGSNELLGRNVIRIDLAYPFDDDTEKQEPTLSVAVGQVFSF